jgi:hypothetical protein
LAQPAPISAARWQVATLYKIQMRIVLDFTRRGGRIQAR